MPTKAEPGTFKDKVLLEKDPLSIIEGMAIAGYVFNSHDGYIYIRGEYREIQKLFQAAIDNAVKANYLGDNIMGSYFSFRVHIVSGAGAYICGENSGRSTPLNAKIRSSSCKTTASGRGWSLFSANSDKQRRILCKRTSNY